MSRREDTERDEHLSLVLPTAHPLRCGVRPLLYCPPETATTRRATSNLPKEQMIVVKRVERLLRRLRHKRPIRVFGKHWAVVETADFGPDVLTVVIYNLTGGRPDLSTPQRWKAASGGELLTRSAELWLGSWPIIVSRYNDEGRFMCKIELDAGDGL